MEDVDGDNSQTCSLTTKQMGTAGYSNSIYVFIWNYFLDAEQYKLGEVYRSN